MEADRLIYETRRALARLLGAQRPGQIILTCNATESINMALKGYLRQGDKVLVTGYEHNAVARPLKKLEAERQVRVEMIPCTAEGLIDVSSVKAKLKDDIRLLVLSHASNVIGCITPLDEIAAAARERGAAVLVDAAQTAGAYPIDVTAVPVDMLAFTGHKGLMGPTGTGGLYLRKGIELSTLKEGGTGGLSLSPFPPDDPPDRYEAGTMNSSGIAGLHAAAKYLLEIGVRAVRAHEVELIGLLLDGLDSIPGLTYYGPRSPEDRIGLVSFNINGHDPNKVSMRLDREYGIMVRSGLHCAPQAHRLLGTVPVGTVRASLGYFNQPQDIDRLVGALGEIASRPPD
jgi:cysteine desulfurase family protein